MEPFVCNQCPRACGVLRGAQKPGAGLGACRMGARVCVARVALHFDEEPCISGTRGSGTVFFSGCALHCVFCQNEVVSHGCFGKEISVEGLRKGFGALIAQGAHNINLVNPTHYAHALGAALDAKLPVPVVWNSGGYDSVDALRALEGRVQVYLPDLKYVDGGMAGRYSSAPDYFERAAEALLEMYRQVGPPVLDGEGMMTRGLMVRHLILPGGESDSMRVLDWIKCSLPGAWVSLMAQYMPFARALTMKEINRRVTPEAYEAVYEHMLSLGLEDGYVQELGAADERYIPAFDLTGLENLC